MTVREQAFELETEWGIDVVAVPPDVHEPVQRDVARHARLEVENEVVS